MLDYKDSKQPYLMAQTPITLSPCRVSCECMFRPSDQFVHLIHQDLINSITYVLFSIPGTLLAKAILPSTSIAAGALIWSIAATAQAGTKAPAGVYVCRLFVGLGTI